MTPTTATGRAVPLTPDDERLVRVATSSEAATFGTAVAILEVMPRVWATLDASREARAALLAELTAGVRELFPVNWDGSESVDHDPISRAAVLDLIRKAGEA
mgnify:CR=1 FL=1